MTGPSDHSLKNTVVIAPDGKEIRQHGSPEFPCGYYGRAEGLQVPWHWHEEYECTVVLQGENYCHTPQGSFVLQAGDGIFLNSGTLHSSETLSGGTHAPNTLVFHGRLVYGSKDSVFYQKYLRQLSSPDAPSLILLRKSVPWQADILERIKKASRLCQSKPEGYEFTVRNLLSEILFDIYCYRNAPAAETVSVNYFENDRVKQMLLYLQENYARSITVAELAAHANICERECLRCFQKVLRISPIQYLIRYRISRACQLLKDSSLSVLEISSQCGFESPSYFTKTFRQHMGHTPTEYRKRSLISAQS